MPGYYRTDKYKDRPRSASGLKGVYFMANLPKRPWKAYGRWKSRYVCIGYFETKAQAARAYNLWAMRRFGAGVYLNPISRSETHVEGGKNLISA